MIIDLANKNGVKMAADSQSSSQIGNISRFKGMDLITPTEREARISARNYEDGLVVLADDLMRSAQARYVLLKLGEEGLLIHTVNEEAKYGDWTTDRVSALNSAPRDVSGAGDSLLIATALSIVSGGSIWESSYVGALAAAVQVGRVGNSPIQFQEILQELNL
jgi:bifunctional ADP-heptose synthase (sugar kinase/adenylyltransferase)